MSVTVAVTGASGLLGGNLVCRLVERFSCVRGLHRAGSRTGHLHEFPVDWREVDFSVPESVARALDGVSVVFHCVGSTVQSRWLRDEHRVGNVQSARTIVTECTRAAVERLVFCSSTMTCGLSASGNPVTEQGAPGADVLLPRDGYARSKQLAEALVLDAAGELDVVVVNPAFMLGPFDAKPSSGKLILNIAQGKAPFWTSGSNTFVDSRDVADGMIRALDFGRRGERYILGGQYLSYRDVMNRIADQLGVSRPLLPLIRIAAVPAGWVGDLVETMTGIVGDINSSNVSYAYSKGTRYDSNKAIRELGFAPRPIDEGIAAAISWFRRHGMLD